MATEIRPTILYVDDESENLTSFKASFRRYFDVHTACNSLEAMIVLKSYTIHVIISDQRMPGTPGVQLLEEAVNKYPCQSRILVSAYSDKNVLDIAIHKCQIFAYVPKPWDDEKFRNIIFGAYKDYLIKCSYRNDLQEKEKLILKLDKNISEITELADQ